MATTAILPTSTPPAAVPTLQPLPYASLRPLLARLHDALRRSLESQRPWHELADRSAFSRPESLSEAATRIGRNASYFRGNYAAILAASLAISLASNPLALFAIAVLLFAWCSLYLFRPCDEPLVFLGRQFSDWEAICGLTGLTIFIVLVTSIVSVLASAFMVGAVIAGVHGALRVPEDLFFEERGGGGAATTMGFMIVAGGGGGSGPAGRV